MLDNTSSNKRIAKNSVFLYLRMIVIMGVTLFTSRVVLQSLGIEDYGIYTVVGGIAAMFNILLGSMTDATQRFLTFEIGKGILGDVNKIFSTSVLLHVLIGVLIILAAEPFGLWFLYNKLILPVERLQAAFWVFQCSLISMFILIISIPYNALIIAHERMKAFAYISVLDAFLRLSVAYLLFIDIGIDKLVLYAFLLLVTQGALRFIYNIYCNRNFEESKFHYTHDSKLIKEFGKFASWTLFGNASFILSNQGVSLLLGTFFAPQVNAARGIAIQIQGALTTFVKNFQTAVNPQLTKNYASGNLEKLNDLLCRSSRMSIFLIIIPFIPILMETEFLLKFWLGVVPEYTICFTRYIIITMPFTALINPLEVTAKATGSIKRFEMYVYGSKLFIIPVSYLLLKLDYSPTSVFCVALCFEILALVLSYIEVNKLVGLSIRTYIHEVLLKIILVCSCSFILPAIIIMSFEQSATRFILILISIIPTVVIIYLLGLKRSERDYIKQFLNKHI